MHSCWATDDSLDELKSKISVIPEINNLVQKFIHYNVTYPRRYTQAKKAFCRERQLIFSCMPHFTLNVFFKNSDNYNALIINVIEWVEKSYVPV